MFPPAHRCKRMPHGRNKRVRPDHDIVADIHFPNIKDGQIVIPREVISDMDILPVITVKGLCKHRSEYAI